jgi:hypothetical protein
MAVLCEHVARVSRAPPPTRSPTSTPCDGIAPSSGSAEDVPEAARHGLKLPAPAQE